MISQPRYIDDSVYETLNRVSSFYRELKMSVLMKRKSKFIGFVGDWGVGKDSLALRVLNMDVPEPKLEVDHPPVRRGRTRDLPDVQNNPYFILSIRIIPGAYVHREREENFFDYIRRSDYDFDLLAFCFSLNCPTSFRNMERKWIPKAKAALSFAMPNYIVVGTKSDLPVAVSPEQEDNIQAYRDFLFYSRFSVRDDNSKIIPIRNILITLLTYPKPNQVPSSHSV